MLVILLAGATAGLASKADYLSAKRKFQSIEKGQVKAGTYVPISPAELNSYVQAELSAVAPPGIRNPRVELTGGNKATGRALIDFVKLRSAQGKPPSFIIRQLLQGEHEVAVTIKINSGKGMATVLLERVEIAGVPVQGAALDFILQNYLMPNYPEAKIGKPFQLHNRVERIDVIPGMAYVITR